MALSGVGKSDNSFIVKERLVNTQVKINRALLFGNDIQNLIVGLKGRLGCIGSGYHFKEATVGKRGKLSVRENRYHRIQYLGIILLFKGYKEILERFSFGAVAVFCKLICGDLIELVAALVYLLKIRFLCGKSGIAFSTVVFINGIKVFVKIIGHKTGFYHCVVNSGIKLYYVQKLLGAAFQLLLVFHILGVLIVRTCFGKLL